MDFHCGWFKHPIFVDGDYPPTMREYVDRKSAEQGLSESRLPVFSEEQKAMIKGDIYRLNVKIENIMIWNKEYTFYIMELKI